MALGFSRKARVPLKTLNLNPLVQEMVETLCWMLERMKVLVEPSGVAAAAAVRHRKADFAGKRVGILLSGGNLDRDRLASFLAQPVAR